MIDPSQHFYDAFLQFYIMTYGVCGGAYLAGGNLASTACNVITLPRSVDCFLNTFLNCYMKDCGLIGF
jgi:hypothetical protein